jgi:Phage tail assembly chaperone proteins, E, or 41 or 14
MTGNLNGGLHPGIDPPADDDLPKFLVIEIDPPVEWNGKTYSELRLEEPTGKMIVKSEQELANGANFASLRNYQFALVSNCSGVPRQAIELMRITQIQKAADFLSAFMPGGRQIGAI